MHLLTPNETIVLASNNPGKIKEFLAILAPHPVITQTQFKPPEVEETGLTFVENALLKARNAARYCQLPVLADDSGLVVDALQGAPGVKSARFSGPNSNDAANITRLLQALSAVPETQRTARFICVLVLLRHATDPVPIIAQGVWEGRITRQPAGSYGFGYDPIFWVPEKHCTSAELPPDIKNTLSHRAKALQQLQRLLTN